MNNPRSMVLGWVSLISVAGVSFYFAKQSINERRRQQDIAGERPSTKLDWRERIARDGPQTEQAPRKELHSSPNPVRGSLISSSNSKDDAT
ncbi:hypothetical protein EI94DRAFT_1715976 [Lactarius quietus]|nr:hypothetical protein EI94DRAFT_1715976 [Lactarius quietus]